MRTTLTIGSSASDVKSWWEDISVPAEMVTGSITLVMNGVVGERPKDGVAITIRVPKSPR